MKDDVVKHIAELTAVFKSCKRFKTVQEFWAFKGAMNEVLANLAYVKRRHAAGDAPEAAQFIKLLEGLERKYFKDGMPCYHHYELVR